MIAATIASVLGIPSAAFADSVPLGMASDGTPIYASESDAEKAEVAQQIEISEPRLAPQAEYCEPGWYKSVSSLANTFDVAYNTGVENNTAEKKEFKVKADKSGNFKYTVSIAVEEDFKAWIFAKIKASINAGVEQSWTTTYGSEVSTEVKPYSTLNAQYGVMEEMTAWRRYLMYSNCHTANETTGTAWVPYKEMWRFFY